MKKLSLYSKIAIVNVMRNKRIYIPYIMACVVCIVTFYNLLFINQNEALDMLHGADYVKAFTHLALYVVSFFCVILLLYTNSFLMKNRKKELGLYSILGLEKKNIGIILGIETLITSLTSIGIGIVFSMILSKLFLLILLKLSRLSIAIPMPFSLNVCLYTLLFFLILFFVILLYNIVQVKTSSPIVLLSSSKEGEKAPKSSVLLFLFGIVTLLAGYGIAVFTKNPGNSILGFVFAVFLVIIATFSLFQSGSIFVLQTLKKNRNFYYKPKNFIFVSNMIHRMKQNAAGLATICILCCAVLVAVSSTSILYIGAEDALERAYPTEYQLLWNVDTVEKQDAAFQFLEGISEKTNVKIMNETSYQQYRAQGSIDGNHVAFPDNNANSPVDIRVVEIETYNKINGANYVLADNEILVYSSNPKQVFDTYMINGRLLSAQTPDVIGGFVDPTFSYGDSLHFVCTKKTADSFDLDTVYNGILFDLEGDESSKAEFLEVLNAEVSDPPYRLIREEIERTNWYAIHGGFLFMGAFFGIIFLFATAIIIYYKQITEGYSDEKRFSILKKVGMSNEEIRSTINKQVKSVFLLPIIVAVVHTSFATLITRRIIAVMGVNNPAITILVTGATMVLFMLIYLAVYRQTSKVYYNIVNRNAASS